ncbi:40S ribosomal protein S10b [Eumeta japonica]|uniref:40S ribosomal protein S10b n=1 Tax=Eumeta variegata TaxID=151549 RepID=A0A4C1TFF3_EUMVA|nr:40S ribosomal protein S10b [Eumeta japonica]
MLPNTLNLKQFLTCMLSRQCSPSILAVWLKNNLHGDIFIGTLLMKVLNSCAVICIYHLKSFRLLKRPTRPETVRPRPAAAARSGDVSKTGEDRLTYRRAPGGADKKGDVGPGAGDVEFRGGFGRGRPQ